jgi:hypothetical protein
LIPLKEAEGHALPATTLGQHILVSSFSSLYVSMLLYKSRLTALFTISAFICLSVRHAKGALDAVILSLLTVLL